MKVFVAGATGAVGRPLVRQLVGAGHEVVGMTRTPDKARWLQSAGAQAVVCDAARDPDAVRQAVVDARPEFVMDQLTDLPKRFSVLRYSRFYDAHEPLKRAAAPALAQGALEAGARRLIAQSVAFLYRPGRAGLHTEDDPVYVDGPPPWNHVMPAQAELERRIVSEAPEGTVLRYGFFYGPGTHLAADGAIADLVRRRRYPLVGGGTGVWSFVHVDDAASAAVRAMTHGEPGVYNVVDDHPAPVADWLPAYASALGAKPPRRVPRLMSRLTAGGVPTHMSTTLQGASNAKARDALAWAPRYPSYREGFRELALPT